MESIISVKDLHKKYRGAAVESVSFALKAGEILGLLGPNGAGKTTTLRMITNLTPCDRGEIYIKGYSLRQSPREAILHVGATLEIPSFYNELSGWDNLIFSAEMYGGVDRRRLHELIELVGLSGAEGKPVKHYSTGMRQRLGLARTLIADPELVILDEPANGLDPQGMLELYDLIRKMAFERRIAFIISSHLLHDMEELCTDVFILDHGQSIAQGKTKELLRGKSDTVCLTTTVPERVKAVLTSQRGLEILHFSGPSAEIRLTGITINELLVLLITAQIEIVDFHIKKITLEDLFLRMVRYRKNDKS